MSDNYSEKELWEKFTFEGFLAVSFYAICFFIMSLGMWIEISGYLFENNSIWENLGLGYLISWIVCFLFMCLIPKLNYEMEKTGGQINWKIWKKNKKQTEQIVEKDIKNKKPRKRYKKSHKP